jgi:hypothetical protein
MLPSQSAAPTKLLYTGSDTEHLNFHWRVMGLVDKVGGFSPGRIHVTELQQSHAIIQFASELPDTHTGFVGLQWGREWVIRPNMSDAQIVNTMLKAVLTFAEHEIRENFTFEGKRIFEPRH